MKTWHVVMIVGLFLSVDAVVVGALLHFAVQSALSPLSTMYPALPLGPGAVRRNFQGIARNHMNMGWSVHLAADETHLHVLPAAIFRMCGAKASSVPWDAIQVTSQRRWTCRLKIAGAGNDEYVFPAWVGNLATGA